MTNERRQVEPGSTVGNRGEPSAETVPNQQPDDERLAATDAQGSGEGAEDERVQGRGDEWPHGHRFGPEGGGDGPGAHG